MADSPVITRFAPSPTGHLHIGGARTALFCWAFARRMGGRFLLRVEDTDQARSSEASARGILEDLAWLGIDWDEGPLLEAGRSEGGRAIGGDPRGVGPFFQSQRRAVYDGVIDGMLERGSAYADFSSSAELDARRKRATEANETFRYRPDDGEILPVAEQRRRIDAGESHVVRLRSPQDPVRVVDEVLGEVKFGAGEVDDFVLRKPDGFPTYHFGVVVDDETMGVTHVLRGQEHLMNTPRHVVLQRVLGYRMPVYAHMPLIFNDKGAKMSKRERDQTAREAVKTAGLTAPPPGTMDEHSFGAWLSDKKRQLETRQLEALAGAMHLRLPEVSVDDFRRAGYLPEVICNFIALLGWNPGMKNEDGTDLEKFDRDFLARHFDLARIGKTNSRFDRRKLESFNHDAIGAMSDDEFARRWRGWCAVHDPGLLAKIGARFPLLAAAVRPRCATLADGRDVGGFALIDDDAVVYDPGAVKKHLLKGEPSGLSLLARLGEALARVEPWEPGAIQATVERFAAEAGVGIGQVAQSLRVAVTGTGVSPGLGETLALVVKAGVLRREGRCGERAAFSGRA